MMKKTRKNITIIFTLLAIIMSFSSVVCSVGFDENGESLVKGYTYGGTSTYGLNNPLVNELEFETNTDLNWEIFDTKNNVKENKVWTIVFNDGIDGKTLENNIYVSFDSNGNEIVEGIDINISSMDNNKVIIYPPTSGWTAGKAHYIFIKDGIKSSDGKKLNKPATMKFIVKNTVLETDALYMISLDNKIGYINRAGDIVIDPIYEDGTYNIYDKTENLAGVSMNGLWGYINKQGDKIIDFQYHEATEHEEGLANVLNQDMKTGYIDGLGKTVIPFEYDRGGRFSDGLAAVAISSLEGSPELKWGYINKLNELIIDFKYEGAQTYSEGLIPVQLNGKWGFINDKEETIIDFQFDFAYGFYEGLASVKVGDEWGYIDNTGTFVIEPQYENAFRFSSGLANVSREGKFGFIDRNNEFIIDEQFDWAISFRNGLARVVVGDKSGYIDTEGKMIYKPTN